MSGNLKYGSVEQKIWELYEAEMASRNDADYEVNEEQMRKLIDSYAFFTEIAERDGGKVDKLRLKPKEINGGVTCYFTVFYLYGKDLQKFCEIVGNMSAISIDTTSDGDACISFTIPRVFKKK